MNNPMSNSPWKAKWKRNAEPEMTAELAWWTGVWDLTGVVGRVSAGAMTAGALKKDRCPMSSSSS